MTHAQYGNFEVVLEMNNDFGPDSGLFLRSDEKGTAYQALIDYHADGNLMGVYGEGFSRDITVLNFRFLDGPEKIKREESKFPLPVRRINGPISGSTGSGTCSGRGSRATRRRSTRGSTACSSCTGRTRKRRCPTRADCAASPRRQFPPEPGPDEALRPLPQYPHQGARRAQAL